MSLSSIVTGQQEDDRGVSPVIAVILMVAITVILSAVIGTFVLDIGGSLQQSPPQAAFSMEHDTWKLYRKAPGSRDTVNTKTPYVKLTHESGEAVDTENIRVLVDGEQAFATGANQKTNANYYGCNGDPDLLAPVYPFKLSGDEITAGESTYLVFADEELHEKAPPTNTRTHFYPGQTQYYSGGRAGTCSGGGLGKIQFTPLDKSQTIRIVWETAGSSRILFSEEIPDT